MPKSRCSSEGCEKQASSRGLCHTHYCRLLRTGTTEPRVISKEADDARFLSKVRKSDGCWIWTGTTVARGTLAYGQFAAQHKRYPAHRYGYELWVGPIPDGMTLDHVKARGCTSTLCVNPDHLEPVSRRENTLRSDNPMARNKRKTHCIRGHEFTPENTTRIKSDYRECRECRRASKRRRYAERVQERSAA